jgi:hypothetical protein
MRERCTPLPRRSAIAKLLLTVNKQPCGSRDRKELPIMGEQRAVGQKLAAVSACGPCNEDALITRPGPLVNAGSHASEQDRFRTSEPEVAGGKAGKPARAIKGRPHKLGSDTTIVAR